MAYTGSGVRGLYQTDKSNVSGRIGSNGKERLA